MDSDNVRRFFETHCSNSNSHDNVYGYISFSFHLMLTSSSVCHKLLKFICVLDVKMVERYFCFLKFQLSV